MTEKPKPDYALAIYDTITIVLLFIVFGFLFFVLP